MCRAALNSARVCFGTKECRLPEKADPGEDVIITGDVQQRLV